VYLGSWLFVCKASHVQSRADAAVSLLRTPGMEEGPLG
jgi:hypothetical protein